VAVSLAKVADVDFALDKENVGTEGFQKALKKLENLKPPKISEATMLEKKVCYFLKCYIVYLIESLNTILSYCSIFKTTTC
jgi:hypothetical protein